MNINIRKISKNFGNFQALSSVDLEVKSGELLALLGPSGSGKTTLLRIIAGLETPNEHGAILFGDENVTYRGAKDRGVGFVFQHYALFRHMTVFENIAFGLRVRPTHTRPGNGEIKDRVFKLLRLVQLGGLEHRYPSQLSGGQRQRVALARALAVEPKVLLLDEPFGALDAKVRKELRRWLRELHSEIHVTSIFVTHDQEEALELADRVVIMNAGRIEQIGTPEEVYDSPANSFIYKFLGSVNTLTTSVTAGDARIGSVTFPTGLTNLNEPEGIAFIRPHEFSVSKTAGAKPTLTVTLKHIQPVGAIIRLEVTRQDNAEILDVELSREEYRGVDPEVGDTLYLTPQRLQVYPPDFSI
ncbi:MAG: sulfate/molybdate ABC transporter ATP-binding protein [Verrucomicrobiales bacterium]|jgi:sulfate transport system ATP-binding protein|nr:sulfate/molybdate ABC transporter ATP-binding protein [Verrucomicrobiales bacterium]